MSSRRQDNNDGTIARTLKIAEANSRDVGRRIGRVDPKVATEMGLSTGDAIEISAGKKKKLLSSIGLLIKRIMEEG
jgi:transitional endoplasmic reticulum ATPase